MVMVVVINLTIRSVVKRRACGVRVEGPVVSAGDRSVLLDRLIGTWELQQDAYVRNRSDRFGVVLDAIAYARPAVKTVLDLGAGLGSFSKRILQTFPEVTVMALDFDPALQELARYNLHEHAERVLLVEADLRDPSWPATLGSTRPDAVVSSTALHWLATADLLRLYYTLGEVLGEGALFFNCDHLSHPVGTLIHEVSVLDDRRHQQAAFTDGVPDWDAWWEALRDADGFADLVAERDTRFADAPEKQEPTTALHIEALRCAGFGEAGTLWQYLDDYVVYGVR